MSVLSAMVAYATVRTAHPAAQTSLAILGTSLAAGGALSLNQWWERAADAEMARTCRRPLPAGEVSPALALGWSVLLSISGVGVLALGVNGLAAALAFATIVIYGLIYTPLKRRSRWATEVGAMSGALPALLGNAAGGDVSARGGVALAVLLLLWQMPHFFAIGWKHRHDYRAAGFRLLPAVDRDGQRTAQWTFGYAAMLALVSVAGWSAGWGGVIFGGTASVAALWFAWAAWRFLRAGQTRDAAARKLFLVSIIYLPIVMGALVVESFLAR